MLSGVERDPRSLEDLSDTQLERFARHLSLDGFGPEAQLALLRARVLVVGAGGLGAPVLTYLAAAGVGEIHVIDDDVVDRSNLHRQVIHAEADLGRAKVTSAAETMRGLHPEVTVVEHRERLTAHNALDRVRGMDLVVDGSDNYATRYLVADACEIAGVPVVWGAILRFAGQVSVFAPGGPLYRDVFPEEPEVGTVPTCAAAGVVGVLPGIVGSLMAAEAIKVLTGIGETLAGRLVSVDALTLRFRELAVVPDPEREPVRDLAVHGVPGDGVGGGAGGGAGGIEEADAAGVGEISAADLAGLMADPDRRSRLVLVDVRDDWERRADRIDPAPEVADLHVPLGELLADPAAAVVQARAGAGSSVAAAREPADAPTVVVYCAAGTRSVRARAALAAAEPGAAQRLLSLTGGLQGWPRRLQ